MKARRLSLFTQLFVQFVWTAFLVILLLPRGGGSMAARFLSPRYFWLLYLSIAFFGTFMFITLYRIASGSTGGSTDKPFLYLLIPVLLFPIAKNAQLGSASVNRREVESVLTEKSSSSNTDSTRDGTVHAGVNPFTNPLDSLVPKLNDDGTTRLTDILMNDEQFLGKEVEIVGRAEIDDILPDGSFYLYRFIIFCCAADATPAGLIIYGYGPETDIEEGAWYRLKGIVSLFEVEGKEYMAVETGDIGVIESPGNPYEYYY